MSKKLITRKIIEKPMVAGVISDTHGLLRPEAVEALRGSDCILHAGDIGAPEVVEAGGVSDYILHDLSQLDLKPEVAGFRVVIYGHSHQPQIEERNGILYFNPGSAGPRRFHLPVSVGRLMIEGGKVRAELMELET